MQYLESEEEGTQGLRTDSWPEDGLEVVEQCPVCEASDRKVMYEGLTDRVFRCAPGEWTLYQCKECASGYLDPRPNRETIALAYQQYYTHGAGGETKLASDLNWVRRLRRSFANGYCNVRYGTDYQPASRLGGWLAYVIPSYRHILDRKMRHLPKQPSEGRLLDIGCGDGSFLKRAEEAGWIVKGVDPDQQAVEIAQNRGLDVCKGGVEVLNNERSLYDIVTLSHVVEHVHDPPELLAACFRLLKRGGILWVETPNLDSIGHKHYGQFWRGLEPPRHLVLFSLKSMQYAVQSCGFRSVHIMPVPYLRIAKHVFVSSSRLENGENPYDQTRAPVSVRLFAAIAALRSQINPRVAEFITLTAVKR